MFLHYNKIIDFEFIAANYPTLSDRLDVALADWIFLYLRNLDITERVEYVLVQTTKIQVLVDCGIAKDNLYFVIPLP